MGSDQGVGYQDPVSLFRPRRDSTKTNHTQKRRRVTDLATNGLVFRACHVAVCAAGADEAWKANKVFKMSMHPLAVRPSLLHPGLLAPTSLPYHLRKREETGSSLKPTFHRHLPSSMHPGPESIASVHVLMHLLPPAPRLLAMVALLACFARARALPACLPPSLPLALPASTSSSLVWLHAAITSSSCPSCFTSSSCPSCPSSSDS